MKRAFCLLLSAVLAVPLLTAQVRDLSGDLPKLK